MAAKGGPRAITAYEWCATHSPAFLRIHRILSLVWSAMFITYAVLRVVIIYSASSVDQSVWLNEIPGIATLGICLFASARAGDRLAQIVEARMSETAGEPAGDGAARPGASCRPPEAAVSDNRVMSVVPHRRDRHTV
jgi:hypothetical protein